jgi:hypothetical protein
MTWTMRALRVIVGAGPLTGLLAGVITLHAQTPQEMGQALFVE